MHTHLCNNNASTAQNLFKFLERFHNNFGLRHFYIFLIPKQGKIPNVLPMFPSEPRKLNFYIMLLEMLYTPIHINLFFHSENIFAYKKRYEN